MMYAWHEDNACKSGVDCGDCMASGRCATLASSLKRMEPPGASSGLCKDSRLCKTSSSFSKPCFRTCGSLESCC